MDTLVDGPTSSNELEISNFNLDSIIKCWVLARYDQSSGYLNLSSVENDKELSSIISKLPQHKRPAIEKISLTTDYWIQYIFSVVCEVLPNLTSLNLGSNSLTSLSTLKNLFKKDEQIRSRRFNRNSQRNSSSCDISSQITGLFSKLQSLSISDNSISSIDDIVEFIYIIYSNPQAKLTELLMSGNPVIASAYLNFFPPTPILLIFLTFALKFPKLSILDRVNIDPYRQAITSKASIPSSFDPGLQDILTPFLHLLIAGFDSSDHSPLNCLYSTHAETRITMYPLIFFESAITKITTTLPDVAVIANIWSNIQKTLTLSTHKKDLFLLNPGEFGRPDPITYLKSPALIYEFLSQLPQLKHSLESISIIAFNGRPLFVPEGEIQVIQVFFTGVFYEGSSITFFIIKGLN